MSESSRVLNERNELLDHALDQLQKIGQKWNDRLEVHNLRLVDRYIEGELELLIHMKRRTAGPRQPQHFCAVLKHGDCSRRKVESAPNEIADTRRPELFDCTKNAGVLQDGVTAIEVAETQSLSSVCDDKQDAVLVGIVQFAEHTERLVPSVVRLDTLNESYRVRMDSLYLRYGVFFEFGRTIVEREAGLVDAPRGPHSLDEPTGQVIEGTSQVVNDIADNQRNIDEGIGTGLKNALFGLRVLLAQKGIWAGFSKDVDASFEITDVVVGPFDFRPNLVVRRDQAEEGAADVRQVQVLPDQRYRLVAVEDVPGESMNIDRIGENYRVIAGPYGFMTPDESVLRLFLAVLAKIVPSAERPPEEG